VSTTTTQRCLLEGTVDIVEKIVLQKASTAPCILRRQSGAGHLKIPKTVRTDADLLEAVRHCAVKKNRNRTTFIETALRNRLGAYLQFAPHSRPRTMVATNEGQ
jgi:hypothetical protein